MKRQLTSLLLTLTLAVGGGTAWAASHDGHDMTGHANQAMDHAATDGTHGAMDGQDMNMAPAHQGQPIRQTTVDGYQLSYELIDMKAQMAGQNMPAEMKSHHLMLYVTGPGGDRVTDAKTGYLVTGPAGEQKAMTMAMAGGYGADVDFEPAGSYTVKTKVVTPDGKKLTDQFTYDAQ